MRKNKRIELFLPEDHPIWSYPKGMRRCKAIELLNIGLQIDEHLKQVEKKLENYLERMSRGVSLEPLTIMEDDEPEPTKVKVDIAGFGAL